MKKFICLMFSIIMLFNISAFAESENEAFVNVDEKMLLADDVIYNDAKEEISKDGDAFVKKASGLNENPVISFNKEYTNEIFNMDMEFDFIGGDGQTASFDGFQLRAAGTEKVCWTTNCYVIIIRENSVEIQAWKSGGQEFLMNRSASIPKNKRVNVKVGAVDVEGGTYIFLKVDDQLFGALDTKSRLQEGYFNLEWRSGLKIYPAEEAGETIPKIDVKYDADAGKVLTNVSDITGISENLDVKYKWYISNDEFSLGELDLVNLSENFTLVDGEENDNLLVMKTDIGKYVYCEAVCNGITINSEICYISPVEYLQKNGLVACVGYTGAIAEGKKFVFDSTDRTVYADVAADGYAYLPLRGVVEQYDYPIQWDGETQIVSITTLNDAQTPDTALRIGEKGFIKLRLLMSSSMPGIPYIHAGRTYLDVYALQQVLNYNQLIYDEEKGLIVFSNPKIQLSNAEMDELINVIMEIQ